MDNKNKIYLVSQGEKRLNDEVEKISEIISKKRTTLMNQVAKNLIGFPKSEVFIFLMDLLNSISYEILDEQGFQDELDDDGLMMLYPTIYNQLLGQLIKEIKSEEKINLGRD